MKTITLHNTNLSVPEIGMGCMRINSLETADAVKEWIDTALAHDINFFDHADIYAKASIYQTLYEIDKKRKKVEQYIEQYQMIGRGDRIVTGVSGGADSVCLLFVLTKLRDERQKSGDGTLEITAVHVHHGLRGDSADADECYVRKICDAWNVPLVVYHKNIRKDEL